MDEQKFNEIKKKYGKHGGWAGRNTKFVFVALTALNHATEIERMICAIKGFEGAYMTDLAKDIANPKELGKYENLKQRCTEALEEELEFVGCTEETVIIALGCTVYGILEKYLKKFQRERCVMVTTVSSVKNKQRTFLERIFSQNKKYGVSKPCTMYHRSHLEVSKTTKGGLST